MTTKKTEAPEKNVPLTPDEKGRAIAENSPFPECYVVDRSWRAFWGSNYTGPKVGDTLPHGQWVAVAEWITDEHEIKVCVSAMPARFYKISERVGTTRAYQVVTGSGEHRLAKMIAEAMSLGMLAIEVGDDVVRRLSDEAREVLGIPQRVG